jgi:hypothetical protein
VGDIDGDGVADYAVADPYNQAPARVTIYSGAGHMMLREFTAPPGEISFGLAIFPTCDMDQDGIGDNGIGAILPDPVGDEKGIVHVYSTVSGKEIAYIKELDAANINPEDVKVLGDLNQDKRIDEIDLLMWIASINNPDPLTDPMQLDLNKDGRVDGLDVLDLFERLGFVGSQQCELSIVNWLNTGGLIVGDPEWPGWLIPHEFQPTQMGIIGCAWCAWTCGKHLTDAAECGDKYRERRRTVCDPLADAGDYFRYSQCLDDLRLNFLPQCLKDIADAAGECGKCVTKCGPQPSR